MAACREVITPGADEATASPRLWRLAIWCLVLLLGGCRPQSAEVVFVHSAANPRAWLICAGIGVILLGLSLWQSGRSQGKRIDGFCLVLISALGLYMLFRPCVAYYQVYHDLPWAWIGPVLGLLLIAGWIRRQRWVSVVAVIPLLFLAIAASLPPAAQELPLVHEDGNLSVTIQSVHHNGPYVDCQFMLSVPPGQLLRQSVDLSNLQVHSGLLGILPQPGLGPGHTWSLEHWAGSRLYVQARFRTPRWSRTTDVEVTVPRWPQQPLASVSLDVPAPPAPDGADASGTDASSADAGIADADRADADRADADRADADRADADRADASGTDAGSANASSADAGIADTDRADAGEPLSTGPISADGLRVTVENLGTITPQAPDVVALRVSFEYEGSPDQCCKDAAVRVVDQEGTVLAVRPGGLQRGDGQMRGELRIQPVMPEVKGISVQLFTDEQLRDGLVRFRFNRMPIFATSQMP